MSFKDFRDDWETWGNGKKIVSIIVGCCVLTFVLTMIAGVLTPDVNDTYDYTDDSSNVDENEPFNININNVSVVESSISFTSQDSESSSYAYFYQDGSYAEPAYTTYDAKDFYIVLNMKDLEIDNATSELEYSQPFGPTDTYNVSNLNKDISKLVKSDNATITMNCYDKDGEEISSYYKFDVSMENGILTLSHSESETSDYHTGKQANSGLSDYDHATIEIKGTLSGKNGTRDAYFRIFSDAMDIVTNT